MPNETRGEVLKILRAQTRSDFQRPAYDGDPISRSLDAMTLEDHLMGSTACAGRRCERISVTKAVASASGLTRCRR